MAPEANRGPTVADVRIFDAVYTLKTTGWSGPDQEWVDALNGSYPPRDTSVPDPVLAVAHRVAREWQGKVISVRPATTELTKKQKGKGKK